MILRRARHRTERGNEEALDERVAGRLGADAHHVDLPSLAARRLLHRRHGWRVAEVEPPAAVDDRGGRRGSLLEEGESAVGQTTGSTSRVCLSAAGFTARSSGQSTASQTSAIARTAAMHASEPQHEDLLHLWR